MVVTRCMPVGFTRVARLDSMLYKLYTDGMYMDMLALHKESHTQAKVNGMVYIHAQSQMSCVIFVYANQVNAGGTCHHPAFEARAQFKISM